MEKSALVAGATGLVGRQLVKILIQKPEYSKIRVLSRRNLGIRHPKLEEVQADFDKLSEFEALFHVDDVFCCLGTTIKKAGTREAFRKVDFEYPLQMAELAKKQNAGKFLMITAMGANAKSNIFYNRVKGQAEEVIEKVGLPSLHIFRPSLLLGERNEFRLGEQMGAALSRLIPFSFAGPLKKFKPIEGKMVAAAMCAIAQYGQQGTYIYLSDQIADIGAEAL